MSRPMIEQNLKQLKPTASGENSHVPYDELVELARTRLPGFSVSSKALSFETDFEAADMAWNHMDFGHRPWVHGLYNDGLRAVMGKEVCFGFSPIPWTPFLVHTFDLKVTDTGFRQFLSIAGVFSVFMQMSILPSPAGNTWKVEWTLLSRNYLKFLHPILHGMFSRLNTRLFNEDIPIKKHRHQLRRQGYREAKVSEGYLESTVCTVKNFLRPPAPVFKAELRDIPVGVRHPVEIGNRRFILHRENENKLLIWDAVCSHQGGPLCGAKKTGNNLICPWHGIPVPAMPLTETKTSVTGDGYEAKLEQGVLTLKPLSKLTPMRAPDQSHSCEDLSQAA